MSFLAHAAAIVLFATPNPPQPDLFPGVRFVRIPIGDRAPELRVGSMRLDVRGLTVGGRLRCTWPGGAFDPADAADMVLGYDETMSEYTPCDAWPLLSTWGDRGVGGATLYLAVDAVEGNTARIRLAGTIVDVSLPDGWTPFETRAQRRARERVEARPALAQPEVQAFLESTRACLGARNWEACLVDRMSDEVRDVEAAPSGRLASEEYVEFLRESGRIEDLRACFAEGAHVRVDEDVIALETDRGFCEVERTAERGWVLRGFLSGC